MKRYIYLFFMLMCIVSCEKPEEGLMPEKSVNANIVRFRIYQNQNLFFDGTINAEENTVVLTIPEGIDKYNSAGSTDFGRGGSYSKVRRSTRFH